MKNGQGKTTKLDGDVIRVEATYATYMPDVQNIPLGYIYDCLCRQISQQIIDSELFQIKKTKSDMTEKTTMSVLVYPSNSSRLDILNSEYKKLQDKIVALEYDVSFYKAKLEIMKGMV
jgi:hypothetical protein